MNRLRILFACFGCLCCFASCNADIISTAGAVIVTTPPTSVVQGQTESDTRIIVFLETRRVLTSAITVDVDSPGFYDSAADLPTPPPMILANTNVASYLVHFDPSGAQRIDLIGSITFDAPVLGIMVNNARMIQSDPILGNPTTTYPQTDGFRGLDFDFSDTILLSSDRMTVQLALTANAFVDQVRIITAVPEPNSALLVSLALPMIRRRR